MQLVAMMEDPSLLVAAEARQWLREFEFDHDAPEELTGIRGVEPFPAEIKRAMLIVEDRIEASKAARFAAVQLRLLQRISEGTAQLRFGAGGYYLSENLEPEVEFGIGRVLAIADEYRWDYREYDYVGRCPPRYRRPDPPRAPQRAHIRRWLAGEDSESEDVDED